MGYENAWQTQNPHHRQFAGLTGFLFTNAFLAYNYFKKENTDHVDFKVNLFNDMLDFEERDVVLPMRYPANVANNIITSMVTHPLKKLAKIGERMQLLCHYCAHAYAEHRWHKTSYFCGTCGDSFPLCSPTSLRKCFQNHIEFGMPEKKYRK